MLLGLMAWGLALKAQETEEGNLSVTIPGTEVTFKMALVPGGEYQMGNAEAGEYEQDEQPVFTVKVDSVWMGVYEVTYDEYHIFREKELDLPAEGQDWNADAVARPSPPYEDPEDWD